MSIRTKLLFPLALLLFVLVGSFAYVLVYLTRVKESMDVNIARTQQVNDYSMRISVLRDRLAQNVLSYQSTLDARYLNSIDISRSQINKLLKDLKPLIDTDPLALKHYRDFEASRQVVIRHQRQLVEAINQKNQAVINRQFQLWEIASEVNSATLLDFSGYNLHALERSHNIYAALISQIFTAAIALTLISILLFVGIYFYLHQIITVPLESITQSAANITRGHFKLNLASISTQDEMGRLANSLVEMSIKIQKYYRHLQTKVRRKEIELRQTREFEAQKDDFLSTASHELKTPVTSLKIYSQLLAQKAKGDGLPSYLTYLNKIDDQVSKLTSLITTLLDVSRIQANRFELVISQFDLGDVVNSIVEVYRHTNPSRPFL